MNRFFLISNYLFYEVLKKYMIDPSLLEILACPETKAPLTLAEDKLVGQLNQAIAGGTLKNKGGEMVKEAIDGALVRADGKVAYLIRDEIPIMLTEEAVMLPPG